MFDINSFDQLAFGRKFDAQIDVLKKNERITKTILGELSRDVLAQLHTNEDVRPVNTLIGVLTPVNRKVAILYFKHHSGFKLDEDRGMFTVKHKSVYAEKRTQSEAFLSDADNNIWTWAAQSVDIQPSDFSLDKVKKTTEALLKKAKKNNFNTRQVLSAIIQTGFSNPEFGFTAADIAAVLADMAPKEPAANGEEPAQQAA